MEVINKETYKEISKKLNISIESKEKCVDVYHKNNWDRFTMHYDEENKNECPSYIDFFFNAKVMVDFLKTFIENEAFEKCYIASLYNDRYKLKYFDDDVCKDIYDEFKTCVTNKCNELCSRYDTCRFIRFTNSCLYHKYYFQIANHNYVFADHMSYRPLLPKYKVIIFDEAHKLYDVAKQMYGCYLSTSEFTELITYIEDCGAEPLKGFCDSINNSYPKLFGRITGTLEENERTPERRDADIDAYCISYAQILIKSEKSLDS